MGESRFGFDYRHGKSPKKVLDHDTVVGGVSSESGRLGFYQLLFDLRVFLEDLDKKYYRLGHKASSDLPALESPDAHMYRLSELSLGHLEFLRSQYAECLRSLLPQVLNPCIRKGPFTSLLVDSPGAELYPTGFEIFPPF